MIYLMNNPKTSQYHDKTFETAKELIPKLYKKYNLLMQKHFRKTSKKIRI